MSYYLKHKHTNTLLIKVFIIFNPLNVNDMNSRHGDIVTCSGWSASHRWNH